MFSKKQSSIKHTQYTQHAKHAKKIQYQKSNISNTLNTSIKSVLTEIQEKNNQLFSKNVGKLRFVINGRYVTNTQIQVITKTNETYTIQPKTILTVNRFENNIPILRWMAFDLKKFIEIDGTDDIAQNLNNIA